MRRTKTITITDDGRDKGKMFLLTEMPALQAEKWATRALLALTKAGVDVPEDIARSGLAGIAALGLKMLGNLDFADAMVLMEEMFGCVKIIRDPKYPDLALAIISDDDIEEVWTRLLLRREVFELHVNFSLADIGSKSNLPTSAKQS